AGPTHCRPAASTGFLVPHDIHRVPFYVCPTGGSSAPGDCGCCATATLTRPQTAPDHRRTGNAQAKKGASFIAQRHSVRPGCAAHEEPLGSFRPDVKVWEDLRS